jgi:NitT/TauT family transport system permease protein
MVAPPRVTIVGRRRFGPVARLRLILAIAAAAMWQAVSASGIFLHDVVPSPTTVAGALVRLVVDTELYENLWVTGYEAGSALLIGGIAGICCGLVLGGNRFLGRAFEPFLHYVGPTPKIIFFPVAIMWFGVDAGSKVALGALSCFFPIALSTAEAIRQIDPVLLRVGTMFRATRVQMITRITLPAIRPALLTGLRLGLGVVVIGVLLAETKLSNRGLGYLVMQRYAQFDIAGLYALLIVILLLSALANALLGHLGRLGPRSHR